MKVDIGKEEKEVIKVYKGQNVSEIVQRFSKKHSLNQKHEDNLYKQIVKQYQSTLRQATSKKRLRKKGWFYENGQKFVNQKEWKLRQLRKEQSLKQSKSLTFKPEIHSAPKISSFYLKKRDQIYMENELDKNCTFQPQISRKSHEIIPSRSSNIHEELHKDAFSRKINQLRLGAAQQVLYSNQAQCPFKPDISLTDRSKKSPTITPKASEVAKPPLHRRKNSCETVSSDDIRKSMTPMSTSKERVFTFDNKSSINQQKRHYKYAQIYSQLLYNEEDALKESNINLGSLNPRIIDIIYPILEEVQFLQTELNLEEFILVMEKLYKQLTEEEEIILMQSQLNEQYNAQGNNDQFSEFLKITEFNLNDF